MRLFVAGGAQHDEMVGVVAVEQVMRNLHRMQLQLLLLITAGATSSRGLLRKRALEMAHLRHMNSVQADMEDQAG